MPIKKIIKENSTKNHFLLVKANDVCLLMYEGKTIMAATRYDFHAGREDAYFLGKKINKHWENPDRLLNICKSRVKKSTEESVDLDGNIFDYLVSIDLYSTHDDFYPEELAG